MATSANNSFRLSIGLPVYNGERFLAEALDCLLAQTFQDFEIIISDNASTDRTSEICRDYTRADRRVRYVRNQRNLGAIANCNRVFELSTAPLFKWAAHDDLYREGYLESCVRLLDRNPDVILAHSNTILIDENGEPFAFDRETGCYIDPKTGVLQRPDSPAIGDSAVAVERFWQVLAHARWGTLVFGVIRRQFLQQTHLLPNFAGGDRAVLAELALLGRFQSSRERLFLKRFHANVSWALNQRELKNFLSTDGKPYWRRSRQLQAFFLAPRGKPIGAREKSICAMMVAAHCIRIAGQVLAGKEARNAAQGLVWRHKDEGTKGEAPRKVTS
jgi:glycosyltransferase involved in cell wall biosynthesis